MDYTTYSTDCVEVISVIIHSLRCTITPVRSRFGIVAAHCTAFGTCVLTDLYGFGINTEHILAAVYGNRNIPAYFLCKLCRQLSSGVELPAADKIWQIIFALMMQTIKQIVFAVEVERLGGESQSDDFKVGELRNNSASRLVSQFIDTISDEILADSENSDEIYYEVAHKQIDGIQRFSHH